MTESTTTMAAPAIIPVLLFRDAPRMVDWLCDAFGFTKAMVVPDEDGSYLHVELALGRHMVMGGSERGDTAYKQAAHPPGRAMLYVVLEEVDEHCERARAAGAEIVMEPRTPGQGGRDYTARDPEGNLWTFGTYAPALPG